MIDTNNKSKSDSASDMWVTEISRGGLTKIIEEAHQVFLSNEFAIRVHFRTDNLYDHTETSRKTVENMVFADSDVQFSWCLTGISTKVDDEKAEMLLEMFINK